MSIIQGLATVAGLLALAAISLWALIVGVYQIVDMVTQKRREPPDVRRGIVDRLRDWCGYDFPIIEDVAGYLIDAADGKGYDVNRFREELRRKYGNREASVSRHSDTWWIANTHCDSCDGPREIERNSGAVCEFKPCAKCGAIGIENGPPNLRSGMVPLAGLEPATHGLEIRCSDPTELQGRAKP